MLSITGLPAFTDNYIWAIHDAKRAWVVDPGDARTVLTWLQTAGMQLAGILLTHHHGDHIGGVGELLAQHEQLRIVGPKAGRDAGTMPWLSQAVGDGDVISLEPWDLPLQVIETPGHTLDHVCYFGKGHEALRAPLLFCGDTLFAAGCGRLFEGTADQMWASLSRLAQLPSDTLVYCAHEYTLSNLRFALHAEPDNAQTRERLNRCTVLREHQHSTLPSTLGLELQTNPFLRAGSAVEFARRRAAKDGFRS
ncbi:MAG TPA: hydroxyacylglutathione hydrolase [Burkholderiaceae bacterium]|nr:hydroxyacylglutathione hydrolase [Burkholderiaceae bacterium]